MDLDIETIENKLINMDLYLDNYYKQYDWYLNHYELIQKLNLFRILPYVDSKEVFEFIYSGILKIKS